MRSTISLTEEIDQNLRDLHQGTPREPKSDSRPSKPKKCARETESYGVETQMMLREWWMREGIRKKRSSRSNSHGHGGQMWLSLAAWLTNLAVRIEMWVCFLVLDSSAASASESPACGAALRIERTRSSIGRWGALSRGSKEYQKAWTAQFLWFGFWFVFTVN